jgi:hypothetical protein
MDCLSPTSHERLCFYPSSGYALLWVIMDMDCDLFVFSDKDTSRVNWPLIKADFDKHGKHIELIAQGANHVQFTSGGKTGLLLQQDNNLALARIRSANAQVHHFVGICDGCCEGGNYECVHESPFVKRLMTVASQGMRYTTDHSDALQEQRRHRKFVNRMRLSNFPEPVRQRRQPPGSEVDWHWVPDAVFELQGVLVDIAMQGEDSNFNMMPKGVYQPTQLEVLLPLRAIRHRRILAEFRIRI